MHAVPDTKREDAVDSHVVDPESVFLFPATPAQRRFWVLDQLTPDGNSALNMPIGLRWHGLLNDRLLERALNQVVARHEALRTTFKPGSKQLQQVIAATLAIDLTMVEAEYPANLDREEFVLGLMRAEAQRPFDLRAGPLLRARLVHLAPDDHLILITVHHIISDGWSNRILIQDLFIFYTALMESKAQPLPELALQFADYADWLTAQIADDGFTKQRAYWGTKLTGNFSDLALPFDGTDRASSTVEAETSSCTLSSKLVNAARSLGAATGASPFMVFFAAFQTLLHRYTGQVDFLVTSPSANRDHPEFESVVGPFANPLVLRADLRGNPTFRELLRRVSTTTLEAFANQEIPFELLLDEFHATRLQVNFQSDIRWDPPSALPGNAKIELLPSVGTGTVYDLSASVLDEERGARFEIEYRSALFNAKTIERMLRDYQSLLEAAVAEPAKSIATFPLTTSNAKRPTKLGSAHPSAQPTINAIEDKWGSAQPVQPYLGLQLQLIAIWEDVLGIRGVGIRDDFFSLGGNSLLAIRMLQRAETVCGKFISPTALFRHPTIEHLAGEMAREAIGESPTLLRVNDAGTRTPFFYLHGDLSGGGFYSKKLSRALGPDQPFYVMPPHDIRSLPAAPTIEEMAAAHLEVLRAVRPKGPYVIGGFCIGGLVAYELAQQIKASGDNVEMLLIIDAAPESKVLRMLRSLAGACGTLLGWDDDRRVRQFGRWAIWRSRLAQGVGADAQAETLTTPRRIYQRVSNAWNLLRGRLASPKKTGSDNQSTVPGEIERYLPLAFQWASAFYRPKPYDGPIALLLSQDVIGMAENPSREWRELAPKTTVHSLPGSHLECITHHVETLAKEIQNCLPDVAAKTKAVT